jgi:hypothetical protein
MVDGSISMAASVLLLTNRASSDSCSADYYRIYASDD